MKPLKTQHFFSAEGLDLSVTTEFDDAIFAEFYAGYDRAFLLPTEKEEREGFRHVLELNSGLAHQRLAESYGQFCEVCLVAHNSGTGEFIGGANFIALRPSALERTITCNLNYIFIDPQQRQQGYLRRLLIGVEAAVGAICEASTTDRIYIFIEQNDPFKMETEAYEADNDHSGIDQFDRLLIWARMGARIIDLDYVQPPLSQDQEADRSLVYALLGKHGASVDACILQHHLAGFFGISVLKGAQLEAEPTAAAQVAQLRTACEQSLALQLLDPEPLLRKLANRRDKLGDWADRPSSLVAAIRRGEPAAE